MNSDQAEEIMCALALSFSGYEYVIKACGVSEDEAMATLDRFYQRFAGSWTMSPVEEENWATFFILQRMLCKGGNGFFSHRCTETKLSALLFLHLYTRVTPRDHIFKECIQDWERISTKKKEAAAGFVRRWLGGMRKIQ